MEFTKENVFSMVDSIKKEMINATDKDAAIELYLTLLENRIENMIDLKEFLLPVKLLIELYKIDQKKFQEISVEIMDSFKKDQ